MLSSAELLIEVEVENFSTIKDGMTILATNNVAASFIADQDFPKSHTLPKFTPLPFNNFGHFYLFDHQKFLKIIYQTIKELKHCNNKNGQDIKWVWGIGTVLLFSVIIVTVVGMENLIPMHFAIPAIIGALAYFISVNIYNQKINKQIAAKKAEVLEKLLCNTFEEKQDFPFPDQLKSLLALSGQGQATKETFPVLVAFKEDHPFPGFGRLQLENKFFCPPKNLDNVVPKEEEYLMQTVISKLQNSLQAGGIENIGFGKVIVLNRESLDIDSPWLDANKCPLLEKDIYNLQSVYAVDENASVRLFFMVEVLFPKYDSAACFFIRMFRAGNSAGCQIALTTIGPPKLGKPYIKNRLMKFKMGETVDGFTVNNILESDKNEQLLKEIREKFKEKFHHDITVDQLVGLDPLNEKGENEKSVTSKKEEIISHETSWPGRYYYYPYNLREEQSLTFGGDFFGYPELVGTISVAYEQISKLVLECIESHGYDISKYKDKEGKYSINAEKIEKLIVGEVIHMKEDKKEAVGSNNKTANDNKKVSV
ncbi:hypothetical protein [Flavitalea sp.]|nr:hypothetical protein [Flavitalea sp.]